MPLLQNQRWEIFAQAVKSGAKFTAACSESGIELVPTSDAAGHYVYCLIDPRDDSLFYVGKGSGKRWSDHTKSVARNREANRKKRVRISDILAAGSEPRAHIIANNLSANRAFAVEQHVIAFIGYDKLCNLATYEYSSAWRRLAIMLLKLLQYREAMEGEPPSWQLALYFTLIDEIPSILPHLRGAPLITGDLQAENG